MKFCHIFVYFLLFIFSLPVLSSTGNSFRFHQSVPGISEFSVNKTVQTPDGVLWFATDIGLYRYDGKIAKQILLPPPGPSSNNLRAINVTPDGKLWLAYLGSGIAYYDPQTESFQRFYHDEKYSDAVPDINQAWSLALEPGKSLWIGTYTNGLYRYDLRTKTFIHFPPSAFQENIKTLRINSLFKTSHGELLIGTDIGLYQLYDGKSPRLMQSPTESDNLNNAVWDIGIGPGNSIWVLADDYIATVQNDGLVEYDELMHSNINTVLPTHNKSFRSFLFTDNGSLLWIAAGRNGLIRHDLRTSQTVIYSHNQDNPYSISSDRALDLYQDATGLLWIGTAKGINLLDFRSLDYWYWPNAGKFDNLETSALARLDADTVLAGVNKTVLVISTRTGKVLQSLKLANLQAADDPINTIFVDSASRIWVGRVFSGVCELQLDSGQCQQVPDFNTGFSTIHEILEFNGSLWMATSGMGLVRYNPETGAFNSLLADLGKNVTALEIMKDSLWLGTMQGFYRLPLNVIADNTVDISTIKAEKILLPGLDAQSWIMDIKSFDDALLLGTTTGLYHYDLMANDGAFVFGGAENSKVIVSIEPVSNSAYWFATASGIYQYSKERGNFQQYSSTQGLPFNAFLPQASTQADEKLYFGGTRGLLGFEADISASRTAPVPVSILEATTFRDGNQVKLPFSYPSQLTLRYDTQWLQLNFGVMDYLYPDQHLYRFRLRGATDSWVKTDNNQAIFTDLAPGNYTFEVYGANSDGVWSREPATLDIAILPPWWGTYWAYASYAMALLVLLGWFVWYQNRRVAAARAINRKLQDADRLRSRFVTELETRIEKATTDLHDSMEALQIKNVELEVANKRAQDASQLKSRFLADMSHELRTPMNGILGFADLLDRTELDKNQKDYIATIRHSGQLLLDMVGNVLDIAKIESGKISLDERLFSLRACLDETLNLLTPIAYDKGLELVCIVDPELPDLLLGDPARIRQIITNLTGNAIKFTQHGSVCVRAILDKVSNESVSVTLAVSDTGIGISKNEQNRLFQTFSQAHSGISQRFGGSGLGLSICKGLAEAMGGQVHIESTPGVGSVFTVGLSLLLPDSVSGLVLQEEHDAVVWQPDSRFTKATVLLYDRHPLSVQAISSLLQTWGIRVVEVHSNTELAAELRRNNKRPRYNACLCALTMEDLQSTEELGNLLAAERGKTPLLILASTLSMDILCALEVQWQAACLSKNVGSRIIHNALSTVLEEQPQFSRTSRDISNIQHDSALGDLRILITDDNQANRDLLRRILRHHGAHTGEAVDGPETLQRLSEESWDVLLLDIHMPGMSGIDVTRELREGSSPNRQIPVIAVTANALPEMRDWALSHGMNAYLIKPYTEESLLETLATVLTPTLSG